MGRSFLICRIGGVPLRAHWTLFVLLPLFFLYHPLINIRANPEWFVWGLIQMMLLVAAVVWHEFAHALTAFGVGGRADEVVLWPLGGFTSVSDMPDRPSTQALLSLAGPLANLALAALLFPLARATGGAGPYVASFAWLNLVLGVFNLIPACPLDGGQALRTLLRARIGSARGDLWTARVGLAASAGIVLLGLLWLGTFAVIVGATTAAFSFNLLRQNEFIGYSPEPPPRADKKPHAWQPWKRTSNAKAARHAPPDRIDDETRSRIDDLLKQISDRGIGSLSNEDRAFLEGASRRLRARRP